MFNLGLMPSREEKLKVAFQVLVNRLCSITDWTDSFYARGEKSVHCVGEMNEVVEIHGMKVYTEDDQIFITDEGLHYQFPKNRLGMILLRMQKVLGVRLWKQ